MVIECWGKRSADGSGEQWALWSNGTADGGHGAWLVAISAIATRQTSVDGNDDGTAALMRGRRLSCGYDYSGL